jgi:hypothetical protein
MVRFVTLFVESNLVNLFPLFVLNIVEAVGEPFEFGEDDILVSRLSVVCSKKKLRQPNLIRDLSFNILGETKLVDAIAFACATQFVAIYS